MQSIDNIFLATNRSSAQVARSTRVMSACKRLRYIAILLTFIGCGAHSPPVQVIAGHSVASKTGSGPTRETTRICSDSTLPNPCGPQLFPEDPFGTWVTNPHQANGKISGTIVDRSSSPGVKPVPLSGVSVEATSSSWSGRSFSISGNDGRFVLEGLPAGLVSFYLYYNSSEYEQDVIVRAHQTIIVNHEFLDADPCVRSLGGTPE
jgi:hypothetical protein